MKSKRLVSIVLLLWLIPLLLAPFASANSPEFPPSFTVYLSDLPKDAAYVDLLIPLKDTDRHYSTLESQNVPDSFAADAEILSYCDAENYRSYTFHYQDAESIIQIDFTYEPRVYFFINKTGYGSRVEYDHSMNITARGTVKLAVLDANGDILHVSDTLKVSKGNFFLQDTHDYHYNVSNGEWVIETYQNTLSYLLQWFLQVPCLILFNAAIEYCIAFFFKLDKYAFRVFVTNLLSRLAMDLCFSFLRFVIPMFWALTFSLELLVYLGEYLVYRSVMKDVSAQKRLAYTLTANTATLLLGIALQIFFFPMP